MNDGIATERWIDEGGHLAPEAVIEREVRAADRRAAARRRGRARPRVVIAGAGVAGLEALLALRALAADRIDLTLVAPELRFVDRSMAVPQPFSPRHVHSVRLQDVAADHDARWHRGALERVERERRVGITKAGHELAYDMLVLALGARPERDWDTDGVLTFHDGPAYRLLLHQLREGRVNKLAFVKPTGTSWPLPLYDLALRTAAAAHHRPDVELSLVTPEEEPLGIFGARVSAAVATLLAEHGVTLHTRSIGIPGRPGWLDIRPGDRRLSVDHIVTEPRLAGPRLRGIPCGRDGFVDTDAHGRVPGLVGVYAAGDATAFPIKHGDLAAQQADAVAEAIAASVGVDIDPQPFRPVLRGALRMGAATRYLRADISGCSGDNSTISTHALWWPPNMLSGRYLAPYVSHETGEAADATRPTPTHRPSTAEHPLERSAS